MQYLLLIYDNENRYSETGGQESEAEIAEYVTLTEDIKTAGQYVVSNALQPTSTATTIRVRDGELVTTDGPFAETKEQLGGFYLVDVADLDEAVRIAARIPAARDGSIEIRPIMHIEGDS